MFEFILGILEKEIWFVSFFICHNYQMIASVIGICLCSSIILISCERKARKKREIEEAYRQYQRAKLMLWLCKRSINAHKAYDSFKPTADMTEEEAERIKAELKARMIRADKEYVSKKKEENINITL